MAREIEFVSAPEPEDDEPYASLPPRGMSTRVWAALAALAVFAAAIWIATRPTVGTGAQVAAQPTRTVVVTGSPTPSVTQRVCVSGRPINAQFRLIAKRNLPGLVVLPDQSFRCTTGAGARRKTVSESIAVRYGELIVEIQATRRVGDTGQYLPAPSGRGLMRLVSAESQSAGLNVTVDAYGRPGATVAGTSLSELASDVCLQLVL